MKLEFHQLDRRYEHLRDAESGTAAAIAGIVGGIGTANADHRRRRVGTVIWSSTGTNA